MTDQEARIQELTDLFEGRRGTARAYIDFEGRCAFCGRDLIGTPDAYSIGTIDHLLPKSRYPQLCDDEDNKALSCLICNGLKGGSDVLHRDEDPIDMVRNRRDELIKRSTAAIKQRSKKSLEDWKKVKAIVLGDFGDSSTGV